jgi:glycosyltransferase involved in cell wall biosynthesis
MGSNLKDLPLVSILAANYNNSRYVLDTLQSIKEQTYQNIELVIVDDASIDDSADIIEEWLKTYDKPYKYIRHEKNSGICPTCNELIQNAKGKYISFVATDDTFLPDKISSQVKIMESLDSSVAMIYGDTFLMDEFGRRRFGTFMTVLGKFNFEFAPSGYILEKLQEHHFIHWLSALVRRDVYSDIGYYDESLPFEDYDMSIRIARKYQIRFISDIQTVYRIHSQSFSSKVKHWHILFIPIFLKHLDLPEFRQKASGNILDAYLKKHIDTDRWMMLFNSLAGEKVQYQFFIEKRIPRVIILQYLKLLSIMQRISNKIKGPTKK